MGEKKLYDAASTGDTKSLHELLDEDPLLLNRVSFTCPKRTPLNVATINCHLPFVHEILNRNPQLAEELDSLQSSALHIASAKGYVEIVRRLLSAAPDMCMSRDCQGRNPLHLAAMKGHVEVLADLVQAAPIVAAREKVDRGQTVLHLCVKYGHLEALKIFVAYVSDELLDEKDDDGDTILHMAVRDKKIEIIQTLVESTKIDMETTNSKGQRAVDILDQNPTDLKNSEIRKIMRAKLRNSNKIEPIKWLTKKQDAIMVGAVLVATMAFQAAMSPAGGVWQETRPGLQIAGEAVMALRHPNTYVHFVRSNTLAFVSSVSIILLLITGLPFRRRLFMWILMVIMHLTVTSIAATYAISVVAVSPYGYCELLRDVIEDGLGLIVWCVVMGVLLVWVTLWLIDRWVRFRNLPKTTTGQHIA